MKTINPIYDEKDDFSVIQFGTEEISKDAHWGRGKREITLIHYVLKGSGYYNGKKITEGQGFFTPCGFAHEYRSSKTDPWVYFWVTMGGKDADRICLENLHADENGIFEYDFCDMLTLFSKKFFQASENQSAIMGKAKAKGIFYLLMSYHEKNPDIAGNRYVTEAKKYVDANYHRAISVSEIADALFISDRYLYNLFVEHEGISPKKYINGLRISKAALMLTKSDDTISEIARSVGFCDVLAFSRFFSKNTGLSPTAYRQKHRI